MSIEQTKYDVFISYHSNDKTQVFQIVKKLQNFRLRVWVDFLEFNSRETISTRN